MVARKVPFIDLAQAKDLAARYGTPIHVYDEREIRRRARALTQAFSWNAGFREYFAVKATPNPAILRILAEEGCGADCATAPELMLAEAAGLVGERVMLSSNDTPAADFARAARMGAIVNFDAPDMVPFWEEHVGALPRRVVCRVNPGGSFESANGIIGTPEDAKFGMTVPQLLSTFADLGRRGVEEVGIHAFLASNVLGGDYYPRLARQLFELAVRVRDEVGVRVWLIDLSGGVGVAYRPDERPNDIAAIGEGVRRAFEDVLVPAGMQDVAVCTELGRWMLAPAGGLLTRVIHHKRTYHDYLGVDACAANLMRPAIYGAYHHISVLGAKDAEDERAYCVVGRLCENNDQFARDRPLPACGPGDLLFIHDTGAHGFSMGYNYNGALRSAEVLVREDGSYQLIRRAETPADYFATLGVTPEGQALQQLC